VSQNRSETPFDSIESSHQYVALLAQAVEEAKLDVKGDIALAMADRADRRREALQLVLYNLTKLESHMSASRRILNDLRTLRRLLLDERALQEAASHNGAGGAGA
jgi:DNA repair protein RadC